MLCSRLYVTVSPNRPTLLPTPKAGATGFLILQAKRLGLEEAPWVLAWYPCWSGWQDGPSKFGRTGVWDELLRRVREARRGWRSAGSRQLQAVLLGQEILLRDLQAGACLALWPSVQGWGWSAFAQPALTTCLHPSLVLGQGPALPLLQAPLAAPSGLCPLSLCPTCPFLLRSYRHPSREGLVKVSQPSP